MLVTQPAHSRRTSASSLCGVRITWVSSLRWWVSSSSGRTTPPLRRFVCFTLLLFSSATLAASAATAATFSQLGRKPGARQENARRALARLHERTASGARIGECGTRADSRCSRAASSCTVRRPERAGPTTRVRVDSSFFTPDSSHPVFVQVSLWRRVLEWERGNPLHTDDVMTVVKRGVLPCCAASSSVDSLVTTVEHEDAAAVSLFHIHHLCVRSDVRVLSGAVVPRAARRVLARRGALSRALRAHAHEQRRMLLVPAPPRQCTFHVRIYSMYVYSTLCTRTGPGSRADARRGLSLLRPRHLRPDAQQRVRRPRLLRIRGGALSSLLSPNLD